MINPTEFPSPTRTMQSKPPTINFAATPGRTTFRLTAEQFLPFPPEHIFEFFSDAHRLEQLTPPWMRFHVLTPAPIAMAEGTLIDYRLRVHGIPLRWRSRISVWEPPLRFVDEQLRGPYRFWHHEHRFERVAGGTVCHDTVDYAVPLGRWVNTLLVRPDLRRIFHFRQQVLQTTFSPAIPSSGSKRNNE